MKNILKSLKAHKKQITYLFAFLSMWISELFIHITHAISLKHTVASLMVQRLLRRCWNQSLISLAVMTDIYAQPCYVGKGWSGWAGSAILIGCSV